MHFFFINSLKSEISTYTDSFSSLQGKLYLATCAASNVCSLSTARALNARRSSNQESDRSDQLSQGIFPRHIKLDFTLESIHKSAYYLTIHGIIFMKYQKAPHSLAHNRQHLLISVASCFILSILSLFYSILWPYLNELLTQLWECIYTTPFVSRCHSLTS